MSEIPRQERLQAYLRDLEPHVDELRRQGWPAEAHVEATDGKLVVWVKCDMHDLRFPAEAVEG